MIITLNDKGISRASMPQISREHRADFISYLSALGVNCAIEVVPAASLLPTQSELNPALLDKVREGFDPKVYPLLASVDGYVLDGHNRWYVGVERGMNLDTLKADCSIDDLMKLAREFPGVTYQTINDLGCKKGFK